MIRAAVYVRISKDASGEGLGIERQLEACRHLAAAKGWEIDERWILDENDTSASTGKTRPQFERLLRGMESGEVTALLAYKVDRLMRRLDDMVRLWAIAKDREVLVATVAGDLDLTTPSGRSNAMLWGVIAAIEIDGMTQRLQDKAKQSVKAGKNANGGSRPFGWDTSRNQHVPEEAEEIRRIAARLIAGESLSLIARDLNARGVRTGGWTDQMRKAQKVHGEALQEVPDAVLVVPPHIRWDTRRVRMMMLSPRHVGLVTHRGEIVLGKEGRPVPAMWKPSGSNSLVPRKPILDPDTFALMQAAISVRQNIGLQYNWTGQRRHLLTGKMMRCGVCNDPMSAGRQKGTTSYRCPGHLSRSRDRVDQFVLQEAREFIAEHPYRVTSFQTEVRADLTIEINRLQQQSSDLEEAYSTEGGDAARQLRMLNALDVQIAALRAQRHERLTAETGVRWVDFDEQVVLATSAALLPDDDPGKAAAIEQQRIILSMYVRSITLHPTKVRGRFFDESTVAIEFRDPAQFWADGLVDPNTGEGEFHGGTSLALRKH